MKRKFLHQLSNYSSDGADPVLEVSLENSQRLAPHGGINGRGHSVNVRGTTLATSFRCPVLIFF
jgi:hypothetical protein